MRRTTPVRTLARLILVPAAILASFAGCGGPPDGLNRQAVTGTVRWNGEPMKAGLIQFQPSSPGTAAPGGAGIADGSYSIGRAEGLVPGSYRVSITTAPAAVQPAGALPGDSAPPPKEPIPAKYNAKTDLLAEVKGDGPNKFDFELKAK